MSHATTSQRSARPGGLVVLRAGMARYIPAAAACGAPANSLFAL